MIVQWVQQLPTGWTVRGSNPGEGEARLSVSVQTTKGDHPAFSTAGTGSFPGVKRQKRCFNQPLSSAEVAKGSELYLRLPSVPAWA